MDGRPRSDWLVPYHVFRCNGDMRSLFWLEGGPVQVWIWVRCSYHWPIPQPFVIILVALTPGCAKLYFHQIDVFPCSRSLPSSACTLWIMYEKIWSIMCTLCRLNSMGFTQDNCGQLWTFPCSKYPCVATQVNPTIYMLLEKCACGISFCFCFQTQEGALYLPAHLLLDARARRDPLGAWKETRRCVATIRVGGEEL